MPEAENVQKTHSEVFPTTFLRRQNFGPKNRIVCTSFGLSSLGHVIYPSTQSQFASFSAEKQAPLIFPQALWKFPCKRL